MVAYSQPWTTRDLAAMPDACLTIHGAIANRAPDRTPRVALRWSLEGTHSGWGRFGAPTGASLYVMGLTHALVSDGRIEQEWMLVDDVSIWKQVLAAGRD